MPFLLIFAVSSPNKDNNHYLKSNTAKVVGSACIGEHWNKRSSPRRYMPNLPFLLYIEYIDVFSDFYPFKNLKARTPNLS
jgi:hypothetical protein